jgi:hypothetical protein
MADISGFDISQLQTLSIAMMKEWVRKTEGFILTGDNGSTQGETIPSANLSTTNPTREGLGLNKDHCYESRTTHHFPLAGLSYTSTLRLQIM